MRCRFERPSIIWILDSIHLFEVFSSSYVSKNNKYFQSTNTIWSSKKKSIDETRKLSGSDCFLLLSLISKQIPEIGRRRRNHPWEREMNEVYILCRERKDEEIGKEWGIKATFFISRFFYREIETFRWQWRSHKVVGAVGAKFLTGRWRWTCYADEETRKLSCSFFSISGKVYTTLLSICKYFCLRYISFMFLFILLGSVNFFSSWCYPFLYYLLL